MKKLARWGMRRVGWCEGSPLVFVAWVAPGRFRLNVPLQQRNLIITRARAQDRRPMGFAMNLVCQSIFRPGYFDLVAVRQAMRRVFDPAGLDQSFLLQFLLDAPFDGFMIRRIHEISVAQNSAISVGLWDCGTEGLRD